jgi:uncharacterized protein
MNEDLNQPLSDDDIDTLDAFLASLDSDIASFEGLDGFFCALNCAPTLLSPSDYLPVILGSDDGFKDIEQARVILTLITRHWNTVAFGLREALEAEDLYLPILLLDENGTATGNDWAEAFLIGVSMTESDWEDFIEDEELGQLLVPMMVLAHEDHPDPNMRSADISPESREELLQMMFNSLILIFAYFETQRQAPDA